MEKEIKKYLEETSTQEIKEWEVGFSKTFGLIEMSDARKAEIKVSLELDQDEWEDN